MLSPATYQHEAQSYTVSTSVLPIKYSCTGGSNSQDNITHLSLLYEYLSESFVTSYAHGNTYLSNITRDNEFFTFFTIPPP